MRADEPAVLVRRLSGAEDLPLPEYQSSGASGADLHAAVPADAPIMLRPGARALIPSGIAIALAAGWEAQVRPRSGLALKSGVTVLNAPGTVDSDYRGEIGVVLANLGTEAVEIARGMRIAQLVIAPVARATWHEADTLPPSARGSGGFGSTGSLPKEGAA